MGGQRYSFKQVRLQQEGKITQVEDMVGRLGYARMGHYDKMVCVLVGRQGYSKTAGL